MEVMMKKSLRKRITLVFLCSFLLCAVYVSGRILEEDIEQAADYWKRKVKLLKDTFERRDKFRALIKKEINQRKVHNILQEIEIDLAPGRESLKSMNKDLERISSLIKSIADISSSKSNKIPIDKRASQIEDNISSIDMLLSQLFFTFEIGSSILENVDRQFLEIIKMHYTENNKFASLESSPIWYLSKANKPVAIELIQYFFLINPKKMMDCKALEGMARDLHVRMPHISEMHFGQYVSLVRSLSVVYSNDILHAAGVGIDSLVHNSFFSLSAFKSQNSYAETYAHLLKLCKESSSIQIESKKINQKSILNMICLEYFLSGGLINHKRNTLLKVIETIVNSLHMIYLTDKGESNINRVKSSRDSLLSLFSMLWEVRDESFSNVSNISRACNEMEISPKAVRFIRNELIKCRWMYSLDFAVENTLQMKKYNIVFGKMISLSLIHPLWYACIESTTLKESIQRYNTDIYTSVLRMTRIQSANSDAVIYPSLIFNTEKGKMPDVMRSCIELWFTSDIKVVISEPACHSNVCRVVTRFVEFLSPGRTISFIF
ncbi:hypothetical protein NEAUS04_1560 [Nematocida ausubeli]|nr:hypothetical protein NEAUS07_1605 [Nematocida ausubeli]KAI5163432.1 hypothetical protein NEAUS04_1560 [Nematocida ausubeli]